MIILLRDSNKTYKCSKNVIASPLGVAISNLWDCFVTPLLAMTRGAVLIESLTMELQNTPPRKG
jgi:hypothetical protein